MKFLKFTFVLIFSALFIFACTQGNNTAGNGSTTNLNARTNANTLANSNALANGGNTTANPNDELASGKAVYMEKCVKCHKDNGTGGEIEVMGKKRKAANLVSENAKKDKDDEIIDAIANGIVEEGMPAFKNSLSEAQIKAVVKFIRQDLQGQSGEIFRD
jgi:mono/diheme cytochrome c family protein